MRLQNEWLLHEYFLTITVDEQYVYIRIFDPLFIFYLIQIFLVQRGFLPA